MGICPYRSTISPRSFSILAVVLGGCLGERVEVALSGGQEGRPVEVSVTLAVGGDGDCLKFTYFLDFGAAGPSVSPTVLPTLAVPPGCTFGTVLVRMPGRQHPTAAQLISRDQRVCAKDLGTSSRWRPSSRAFCFGSRGNLLCAVHAKDSI